MPSTIVTSPTQPILIILFVVGTLAAAALCVLRFQMERTPPRNWIAVWDALNLVLAMLIGTGGAIFAIGECASQSQIDVALPLHNITYGLLCVGLTLGKVSICLSIWTLVAKCMVWSTVLASLTGLLLLVNPIYNAIAFAQCRGAWAPYMLGSAPECWNGELMESLDYMQQCFNIFAPLFLASLPIMLINGIPIPRRSRPIFYILASTIIIVTGLAIARAYCTLYLYYVAKSNEVFVISVLAVFEQNIGIIAANMLPLAAKSSVEPIIQAFEPPAAALGEDPGSIPLSDLSRVSTLQD
ncbi:hypothetical protein GGR54DRAFT_635046 [Hypoxylon sp. NC1633]|nr:hypothetical protein GGR54DRAFT_635046 [Hypoxylon sp. NC1633]